MNKIQQKYNAFMESVCAQFNCKQALPALKQGFKAFCESVDVDYDPFDIDNMVANASDAEFGAENNDDRYNVGRYTGQGSEEFDEGNADDTNIALVTQRLAKRLQTLFDREPSRGDLTVEPSDMRDNRLFINTCGKTMGFVIVSGDKVTARHPSHSENGSDFAREYPIGESEFDLDDPQLADKVAAVYLDRAPTYLDDIRKDTYVDSDVYNRRILNAGADMNDEDFANALHNNKFDHLRYK